MKPTWPTDWYPVTVDHPSDPHLDLVVWRERADPTNVILVDTPKEGDRHPPLPIPPLQHG